MPFRFSRPLLLLGLGLLATTSCGAIGQDEDAVENDPAQLLGYVTNADEFGKVTVISKNPAGIDTRGPFFQSLGTNGRSCASCHKLDNGMGISVPAIQALFNRTLGTDPIFRTNDGSNAPVGPFAKTTTLAARKLSFSMLLNHGVIRVGIPVPPSADFELTNVRDPYGFASAKELSLFRRPIPSVNMAFAAHVMWDGRESEGRPSVRDALINQANDATTGHAQRATPLDMRTREALADFQLSLFAAQSSSGTAGSLNVAGCVTNPEGEPCEKPRGGPNALLDLLVTGSPGSEEEGSFPPFTTGINDSFEPGFKNISFTTFEAWESDNFPASDKSAVTKSRGDIGDGENIFYTKPINITGVAGLNDVLEQPVVKGTCTTCHNNPDVGNHSRPRFFSIGVAEASPTNPLLTPDFPVYTFRRTAPPTEALASVDVAQNASERVVTDPGLALRTGNFNDIGKFKVPVLRGLGARAPYFHNGGAKTLTDVVKFYNQRFTIGFTDEEIRKVVAFLQQT